MSNKLPSRDEFDTDSEYLIAYGNAVRDIYTGAITAPEAPTYPDLFDAVCYSFALTGFREYQDKKLRPLPHWEPEA